MAILERVRERLKERRVFSQEEQKKIDYLQFIPDRELVETYYKGQLQDAFHAVRVIGEKFPVEGEPFQAEKLELDKESTELWFSKPVVARYDEFTMTVKILSG